MLDSASLFSFMESGFIPGSRGSFVLDFIVIAIFFILLIQTYSIQQVRKYQRFSRHRRLQLTIASVLAVALCLFELEMRTIGWVKKAEASPYFHSWVYPSLYIHLFFAISAFFLWVLVIFQAMVYFREPFATSPFRPTHRRIARPAALALYATAVTGWVFYLLAFVA